MHKHPLALSLAILLVTSCVDSSRPSRGPTADASVGSGEAESSEWCTEGDDGGDDGGSNVCANAAMAAAMGFGVNIGNTLENNVTWETGWGQPLITPDFINGMASRGIKTVRVPVAWDTYAKDGVIDADKMNRVKEVVSWIEAAGMYAIVNIHWDGGWIFNKNNADQYRLTEDVQAKFASYWQQIATAFAEVGHRLILEGLNEEANFWVNGILNGTPDMAAVNTINQLFVTTVRAQGGYNATRALLIAGFATDINKTCVDSFAIPSDPAGAGKLFLSIHYYDPSTFTMLDAPASWGSPSTTWGSDAERNALTRQFTKLGTFADKRRIPVIIGEFAVTRGRKVVRQSESRILWMQSVARESMSRGMVPVLWDTGTDISRIDGSFSTDLQAVMSSLN
jgi:endoglucanase